MRMKKITVSLLLTACLVAPIALHTSADNLGKQISSVQQKNVLKGRVVDENDQPLPGVSIFVEGTTVGTATDIDGNYCLMVEKGDKLKISFIGYKTQVLIYKGQETIDVKLLPEAEKLEEVICTGIMKRKASTFTGSVTTIKKEDLQKVSSTNIFQSLQALDPSLIIVQDFANGSDPNKTPVLNMRGNSTFGQTEKFSDIKGNYTSDPNAPLFILNGFETTVEKVLDLDMNRIESVTILKDASAKAIYGAKASNGVIVIETSFNKNGNTTASYRLDMYVETPDFSSYNMMNAKQKLDFELETEYYKNFSDMASMWRWMNEKNNLVIQGVDTDWLSIPVRNAISQKHSFSFELGSRELALRADLSYNDKQGVMKESERKTYSGSISVTYRKDKFSIRNVFSFDNNVAKNSRYGNFAQYAIMNPYYSPYNKNGELIKYTMTPSGTDNKMYLTTNPLYNAGLNIVNQTKYTSILNNTSLEYYWNDYIKTTAKLNISFKNTNGDQFYPADHTRFSKVAKDKQGSYTYNTGNQKKFGGDINTSYSRTIDKHFMMLNVGASFSQSQYSEYIFKAIGFPYENMDDIIFASKYAEDSKPNGKDQHVRTLSGLAVANYAYDNRFLADGTIRYTGSSQYGKDKRWGVFWSVGLGWNIHEEHWLKCDQLQKLKLRGSVGTTGTQMPSAYTGMVLYTYETSRLYNNHTGALLNSMPNPTLAWQEKFDRNIGLDIDIFNSLSLKIDYYNNNTKNTVTSSTIAPSSGFSSVNENIGVINNRGYEISASYMAWQNAKERSYLVFTASASHNKNEIKSLSDAMKHHNKMLDEAFNKKFTKEELVELNSEAYQEKLKELEARRAGKPLQKYYEGASMNSIWAMRSLGVDPANGKELFVRKDGTVTYQYDSKQQVVVGNTTPKLFGTFGADLNYKGFGINCMFTYRLGGQLYNSTLIQKVEAYKIRDNVDGRVLEGAWSKIDDIRPYVRNKDLVFSAARGTDVIALPSMPTDRFVMDQNDLTFTALNISYDFWKHAFLKDLGLERLKVGLSAQNIATWSTIEIERGTSYPFARNYNFTLSATF